MLPTLSHLSVSYRPVQRLRHWYSSRYLRISPLHREFSVPLRDSSDTVRDALAGLSPGLSHPAYAAAYVRFTPNDSEQRLHPPYYRGCWHGVSRCLLRRYRQGPWMLATCLFVPPHRALRPEGLHHSRGMAGSGLRFANSINDLSILNLPVADPELLKYIKSLSFANTWKLTLLLYSFMSEPNILNGFLFCKSEAKRS